MLFSRRYRKLKKSVVIFTVHKAGSMVLHRVVKDICDLNRIHPFSEHEDKPNKLPVRKIFEGKNYIAKRNGCFGPIRFYLPARGLEDTNILLHLRDPRDVLTSMFFSYTLMHRGPVPANTGPRKEVAEAGIDRYVLDMSSDGFMRYEGDYGTGGNFKHHIGNVLERYQRYLKEVAGKPNAVVVFYEEMVSDFRNWLRKVVDCFELENADETYRFVLSRHEEEVAPTEENPWRHKRKVTPGDYKEKLQPETIAELNHRFDSVLKELQELRRMSAP